MGVGQLLINAIDRTSMVHEDAFEAEFQANRLNGVLTALLKDDAALTGGTPIIFREQDEVLLNDGGTRVWGGRLAVAEPRLMGKSILWNMRAQSFDVLLDQRVIESGVRTGARTDASDVQFIAGFHTELESATFVSTLKATGLPDMDYSGMTLRKALERLMQEVTGAIYWVDENKKVHWTDPQSAQKVTNTGWDSGASTGWGLDGSAVVTADAGPGGTGDYALITTGNAAGRHESTQTVTGIVGNRRYLFYADLWSSVSASATVRLDWQNAGSVSQRIDVITSSGATSTWARNKAVYSAPASATKVIVMLGGINNFTGTVRHDNENLVEETAAFGIDTAQIAGTFAPRDWREPRDAATPINRVLIRGAGISGWREHAASISYFGGKKFEGVLDDLRVTTADGIDSRAAYVFRKFAFPARHGSYWTDQTTLKAGTWQIVSISPLNHLTIEYIATLKIKFRGANTMRYDVTYGDPQEDIASMIAAQGAVIADGTGEVNVPDNPSADAIAPAVPTGLSVTSATKLQPDATLAPYLLASWTAVADADLDAYELQIDRGLAGQVTFTSSASGAAGSLPAGDYAVQVTGNGLISGETATAVPPQVVTVAAGQRLFVNITAKVGCVSYRAYASILTGSEQQPKATAQTAITTTGSDVEITAAGTGAIPPVSSTALAFLNPTSVRGRAVSFYTDDAIGGLFYGARVRAIDKAGNLSAFTSVVTVTAGADTTAPTIPTGLTAIAGFRLVGLAWGAVGDSDLSTYEVRWSADDGTGQPDEQWTKRVALANIAVISGLDPGSDAAPAVRYYFEARSIDRSGNTRTSIADATAIEAASNPEAGWSNSAAAVSGGLSTTLAAAASAGATNIKVTSVTGAAVGDRLRIHGGPPTEFRTITVVGTAGAGGTGLDLDVALAIAHTNGALVVEVADDWVTAIPTRIGQADIAANTVTTNMISTVGLDASVVRSGTVEVGGRANTPDFLLVYDTSGNEIGRWDANGLVVVDATTPTYPARALRFSAGTLAFSADYNPATGSGTWTTAINADGIDSTRITFGAAFGGHNMIPNSGFELSSFSTTLVFKWDTTAEWDATIGTTVNADGVANLLQLVAFTY